MRLSLEGDQTPPTWFPLPRSVGSLLASGGAGQAPRGAGEGRRGGACGRGPGQEERRGVWAESRGAGGGGGGGLGAEGGEADGVGKQRGSWFLQVPGYGSRLVSWGFLGFERRPKGKPAHWHP